MPSTLVALRITSAPISIARSAAAVSVVKYGFPVPAASLRAMEIHAEVILKATKVDGIYSADPVKDPTATRYKTLSYIEVLRKNLKVMDSTAISLCMDNELPIIVFDVSTPGNIRRALGGERIGTLVSSEEG